MMDDYMALLSFTAGLGLLLIVVYVWMNRAKTSFSSASVSVEDTIPRWNIPPSDKELGDLGVMAKHGSIEHYLLYLHDNGKTPITSFWWGKTHVVSVCSPQAFKETVKLFNKPKEMFMDFAPLFGENGVLGIDLTNDEEWERRYKIVYPTLKGEDLKECFPALVEIAQETATRWSSFSPDQHVPLMKEMYPMSLKAFTQACWGDVLESQEEVNKLADAYNKCWREVEDRSLNNVIPDKVKEEEFQRNRQVIVDAVKRAIQTRKEGGKQRDIPFIDSLLQKYDSEEKVIADMINFLVGSLSTAGSVLTWILWYLAKNPTTQERLREEIDLEVKGQHGEQLMEYVGRSDTYFRCVMDETMRLTSVSPYTGRYSYKDIVVCGHTIKAGTPIIHALGVGLKNHSTWKDVDKWNPDRFLSEGKRGLNFCPFGVPSRRKCPGYLFSYFEVGVFMAILLERFKVKPVEGQTVTVFHGFITEPKDELYVYLQERERGE